MKEIIYKLPYREKGKQKEIEIKIDFVSNWVVREFNHIIQVVFETQKAWNSTILKSSEIKHLQEEKPEGYYERIEKLYGEIKELTDQIQEIGKTDILQRRFEVIQVILEDNNVKEQKLFSFDFWDKCVAPEYMLDFLDKIAWKDIDKKKIM